MKKKTEFEKFDKAMECLLVVPYSELQEKLEEERKKKEVGKRKRAKISPASHVSSDSKSGI